MDYEKKYKDALERAKSWAKGENPECIPEARKAVEFIFPELKENEQSKKWILEYLYDGLRKSDEQFKGQFKAAIAWLEKQNFPVLSNSSNIGKSEKCSADKVVEWLMKNVPMFWDTPCNPQRIVEQFKEDFEI